MNVKKDNSVHNADKKWFVLLFVIASLVIHVILITLFMQHGFHKRALSWWESFTQSMPKTKQQNLKRELEDRRAAVAASLASVKPRKKRDLPAQLRAPKSQFGWVMFDEPIKKKASEHLEIPTTLEGDIGHAQAPLATENKAVPAELAKKLPIAGKEAEAGYVQEANTKKADAGFVQPAQDEQSLTNAHNEKKRASNGELLNRVCSVEPNKAGSKKPLNSAIQTAQLGMSYARPEPMEGNEPPTQQSPQERIEQIKALQAKLDTLHTGGSMPHKPAVTLPKTQASSNERLVGGAGGIKVRGATSETSRPKRNIIALTKGFVEKWEGESGTDLIDRDGDPNKRPSFEELKFLSYEAKLNWCLQSSWKQNFAYRPNPKVIDGDVAIEFTLDEHGNLTKCTLLQSSGHPELDDLVMKNMKFASPFPPLPKHFGMQVYTTGRVIQVRSTKFNF